MKQAESARPFAGCFCAPEANEQMHLAFVGLPDDSQSSYRRGCAAAPQRIRTAYNENSYNASTELGADLTEDVADFGDVLSGATWQETARRYCEVATRLLNDGKVPFFAGGDHAVTVPIVASLAALDKPIHVIQLDAHPDLYADFGGDRDSHACTAARMLEMEHVANITQIGIRTLNPPQQRLAEQVGDRLHMVAAREVAPAIPNLSHIPADASVYITLDLDAFDPAYVPGVSHPVPGGLTSRQVIDFLQTLPWKLVGMDVVEVNPSLDVNDQTAILAARLLHETMGRVQSSKNTS